MRDTTQAQYTAAQGYLAAMAAMPLGSVLAGYASAYATAAAQVSSIGAEYLQAQSMFNAYQAGLLQQLQGYQATIGNSYTSILNSPTYSDPTACANYLWQFTTAAASALTSAQTLVNGALAGNSTAASILATCTSQQAQIAAWYNWTPQAVRLQADSYQQEIGITNLVNNYSGSSYSPFDAYIAACQTNVNILTANAASIVHADYYLNNPAGPGPTASDGVNTALSYCQQIESSYSPPLAPGDYSDHGF